MKRLTKDLINKYKIVNGAKYLPLGILQTFLVFISANFLVAPQKFFHGNLRQYQKKVLEILLEQTQNLAPTLINSDPLGNIEFNGQCLVNSNISVNINIFCPTQRLNDTAITAEAKYAINFTESGQIFVLAL